MKTYYVIENVISPGSFYSMSYETFKGFMFATYFDSKERIMEVIREHNIELAKITEVIINK